MGETHRNPFLAKLRKIAFCEVAFYLIWIASGAYLIGAAQAGHNPTISAVAPFQLALTH